MMRKSTCVFALLAVVLLAEASALSFRRREMEEKKPGHHHHKKHHDAVATKKKEPCKKKTAAVAKKSGFHHDVVVKSMWKGGLKAALKHFDLKALKPKKKALKPKKAHTKAKHLHHFSAERHHHGRKEAAKKQHHGRKEAAKKHHLRKEHHHSKKKESPDMQVGGDPSSWSPNPIENEAQPFDTDSYDDHTVGENGDHEHYSDHYDGDYGDHDKDDYDDVMDDTMEDAGVGPHGADAVHDCMGPGDNHDTFEHAAMEGMGDDGCMEPPSPEEIVVMAMMEACHAVCEEHNEHGDSADMAAHTDEYAEQMHNCHEACEHDPFEVTPEPVQEVVMEILETCAPSDDPNTPAPECAERCFGGQPFDEASQWDAVGDCEATFMLCVETEACSMTCPGPECPEHCGMQTLEVGDPDDEPPHPPETVAPQVGGDPSSWSPNPIDN